jgi:hypothetical protein
MPSARPSARIRILVFMGCIGSMIFTVRLQRMNVSYLTFRNFANFSRSNFFFRFRRSRPLPSVAL